MTKLTKLAKQKGKKKAVKFAKKALATVVKVKDMAIISLHASSVWLVTVAILAILANQSVVSLEALVVLLATASALLLMLVKAYGTLSPETATINNVLQLRTSCTKLWA